MSLNAVYIMNIDIDIIFYYKMLLVRSNKNAFSPPAATIFALNKLYNKIFLNIGNAIFIDNHTNVILSSKRE